MKRNCENCIHLGSDGDGPEYNGTWDICTQVERYSYLKSFPFKKEMSCFELNGSILFWSSEFVEWDFEMQENLGLAIDAFQQKYPDEFLEYVLPEIELIPREGGGPIGRRYNLPELHDKYFLKFEEEHFQKFVNTMDEATRKLLIEKGREDLVKIHDINQAGYAGCMPNGNLVDRRDYPEAVPVQANKMMGLPAPQPVQALNIPFIVNGQPVVVKGTEESTMKVLKQKALAFTGYADHPTPFRLKLRNGTPVDEEAKLKQYPEYGPGYEFQLSLPPGVGA